MGLHAPHDQAHRETSDVLATGHLLGLVQASQEQPAVLEARYAPRRIRRGAVTAMREIAPADRERSQALARQLQAAPGGWSSRRTQQAG